MSALENRYLSVKEIAERFGISESKVRTAMRKKPGEPGYLHSVLVGLDSRRVPESSLVAWLQGDWKEPKMAEVHTIGPRRTT